MPSVTIEFTEDQQTIIRLANLTPGDIPSDATLPELGEDVDDFASAWFTLLYNLAVAKLFIEARQYELPDATPAELIAKIEAGRPSE